MKLAITGGLDVTGFSTFSGGVSGFSTTFNASIGVASESTYVGNGVTTLYFQSSNGTAWNVVSSGNTATVSITPGASIGLVLALS